MLRFLWFGGRGEVSHVTASEIYFGTLGLLDFGTLGFDLLTLGLWDFVTL